jgi:hypothetical protein
MRFDAGILARPHQRPEAVVIYRLTEFRIKNRQDEHGVAAGSNGRLKWIAFRMRLPPACFELLFEVGAGLASSSNARLRSGQMKLATSRSALRPFARQGHPPSPD